MENKLTLKDLFESGKAELASKLQSFSLPRDAKKVQSTVSDYLNVLFDSEGDFRQNLTQSEDYILQAALTLLNAQQAMAAELANNIHPNPIPLVSEPSNHTARLTNLKHEQCYIGAGGSALGGGIAGVLLGKWGAVFGAIAGTALALYYASQQPQSTSSTTKNQLKPSKIEEPKLNTEIFMNIVGNICESIDSLIETFRSQINKVVNKYEAMEKPSIEKEYRFLLEGIQSLTGYKRTHDKSEEKYLDRIQTRIEDLAETLENYNLTLENYTGENEYWFEKVVSDKATDIRMVYPAVVRNGKDVVLYGKVFIPK